MLNIKKTFKAGEIIVREKTLGNSAYIIESGNVEVSRNLGNQRVVFTELSEGSIFGEMCLIDNSPRSATVTALVDTTVTILSKNNFQQFLNQHPAAYTIFKVVADRLRETLVMVSPLKLTNFYFSLCSLIYYLARAEGSRQEDQLRVRSSFLLNECCTILALEMDLVEKVINRLVFTKLIRQEKGQGAESEEKFLVIPKPGLFREFVAFLQYQSSTPGKDESEQESQLLSDNTFQVLKVLTINVDEYQPRTGRNSVLYEKYLSVVEDLLKIPQEDTDKLLRPFVKNGIFKLTVNPATNTRLLVCPSPDKLDAEIERQECLRTFQKMVNLLKALAEN